MKVEACPRCDSIHFKETKHHTQAGSGEGAFNYHCGWCGKKFNFPGSIEIASPPPPAKEPRPRKDPPWWETVEEHD